MKLSITSYRDGSDAPRTGDGYRLSAEIEWLIDGHDDLVCHVEVALEPFCKRVGRALLLRFGNVVGIVNAGPLGRLDVHSDKWEEADFDKMLSEITARMALLPFAAGTGAELSHERSIATEHHVLYHAFVYLRHLFRATAPPEDRLVPALRLILAQPHQRFERTTRWVPFHAVQRIEPRALLGMVTPRADLTRATKTPNNALARVMGGHLPQHVEEIHVQSTVDVAENQFVKAFLAQALGIVDRMRAVMEPRSDGHFRRRILGDCDAIAHALLPIRRHALWDEVSEMRRVPVESQVLQRRRGYREVLRYFVRLRLTARLPLRPETTRRLLEIKDIAALYEMWTFFEVERQVTLGLGRPPIEAGLPKVGHLGAHLERGLRVAWEGGIELFYNLSYSRSRRDRSYSLPLRPDVVLRIPRGPAAGDHLFDAKFKVRKLGEVVQTGDDVDEATQSDERRGIFKSADLYKMHTYRDAIVSARTVWILYPGSEFHFFDEEHGSIRDPGHLVGSCTGVGAIPLRPGELGGEITTMVRRLMEGETIS